MHTRKSTVRCRDVCIKSKLFLFLCFLRLIYCQSYVIMLSQRRQCFDIFIFIYYFYVTKQWEKNLKWYVCVCVCAFVLSLCVELSILAELRLMIAICVNAFRSGKQTNVIKFRRFVMSLKIIMFWVCDTHVVWPTKLSPKVPRHG